MKYWLVVFRHPSEKYEFVNWDDNRNSHLISGKIKNWWQPTSPHQNHHQMVLNHPKSEGISSPNFGSSPGYSEGSSHPPKSSISSARSYYGWIWMMNTDDCGTIHINYNDHINYDEYYGWLWIVMDWIIPPFPTKHQGLEYLIPQIKCWVHPKIRTSHPPKLTGAKCVHHIQIYSYSITFSLRPDVPTKIRTSHPFNGNSRILKWRYCTM